MKEPDYQQRIRQLEEALRESKKREACVQEWLKEAKLELGDNMLRVAELQSELDDVNNEFDIITRALADATKDKDALKLDIAIISEELEDVHHQLDIATRDLSDARKDKESLEVCNRSVRGISSSICCGVCCRSGGSTVEAGCFIQVSVLGGACTIV